MSVPPATHPVEPSWPTAAVMSLPTLTLPASTLSTAEGDMSRRTKSVDEPPNCTPALAPPIVYMAGADHLPLLRFLLLRQVIGPRPPLFPRPTANVFTPGSTMMQFAVAKRPVGTALPANIACNTAPAFFKVSSSLLLSALRAGRVEIKISSPSTQDRGVLILRWDIRRLF